MLHGGEQRPDPEVPGQVGKESFSAPGCPLPMLSGVGGGVHHQSPHSSVLNASIFMVLQKHLP